MLPAVLRSEIHTPHRFPSRMYLHDGELDLIVGLFLSVRPATVIEFGVNLGLTAQALLRYVPSITRYIGIDVAPGYRTRIPGQQSEVPINPGILVNDDDRFKLLLRSQGSFDIDPEHLPEADAVFIDGDHSYDAVFNDSQLAYQRIKPGGLIVWHDYGNPTVEVTQALDDLAAIDGHHILSIAGTWLAYEGF